MFKWIKDTPVETNLRALGIPFEVERVQIDQIDWAEGLRRQTRLLGKLSDDTVIQYAMAMQQPDAGFPMILLQKPPGKGAKLWPWGGNHRGAAYIFAFPEATEIEAYTVCLRDPRLIDVLPRVVNAWGSSLGFSKEERLVNARYLMEAHSMTVQEVADLFGLKTDWIYQSRRTEETKARLADIPKANGLSRSILVHLAPLSDDLNVLKQTARLICEHEIRGDEAKHLIESVKVQKTALHRLGELSRWEKMFEVRAPQPAAPPTGNGRGVKKPVRVFGAATRKSFITHLTGLAKILEKCKTLEQLQISSPADRDFVARNWEIVAKTMTSLANKDAKVGVR